MTTLPVEPDNSETETEKYPELLEIEPIELSQNQLEKRENNLLDLDTKPLNEAEKYPLEPLITTTPSAHEKGQVMSRES